jgi:hypothetical protein
MATKRKATLISGDAVVVEHPEGGTFGVIPMELAAATEYAEIASREEFERDKDGSIVFNPKGGALKKSATTVADLLAFAKRRLRYISDFEIGGVDVHVRRNGNSDAWVFIVGGEELADRELEGRKVSATQVADELMTLMGEDQWPHEVPVDANGDEITDEAKLKTKTGTKKIQKPVRENLFLWATRKSAALAAKRNEIEREN